MSNKEKKKETAKRVVAMIGVILLGLSVVGTIITAFLKFPGSDRLFLGMVGLDIIIPCMLWCYLAIYKWATKSDKKMSEGIEAKPEENSK